MEVKPYMFPAELSTPIYTYYANICFREKGENGLERIFAQRNDGIMLLLSP